MALKQETLAKLTTTLASDLDLYNEVVNEFQTNETELTKRDEAIAEIRNKHQESETRNDQYLKQISNLLSKIPVGNNSTPQTVEDQLQAIKERAWSK